MQCQEIRELLSPYCDGVLDETQRLRVEEHLQGCEQCRQELEELRFVIELMQGSAGVLAPEGFSLEVMNRIASLPQGGMEGEPGRNRPPGKGWIRRWGRIAAVAAMLVVAVAIGVEVNGKGYFALNHNRLSLNNTVQSQSQVKTEGGLEADSGRGSAGSSAGSSTGNSKERVELQDQAITMAQTDGSAFSIAENSPPADPGVNYKSVPKASVTAAPEALSRPDGKNSIAGERKLITKGRVQVEVADFDSAYTGIIKAVEKFQGYVENSTFSNSPQGTPPEEQYPSGRLTVRVPAGQFNAFFEEVKKAGTVVFRELGSQDVSAEFYDTQARLRNWRQQEARLLEILKQAKNVDEILKVEGELQRVRQEIEVMEGRIKNLGNLSGMATLEIELNQVKSGKVIQVPEGKNVFQNAAEAFIGTVNDLLDILGKTVVLLGGLAPVLIILAIAAGLLVTRRRRKNGKLPGKKE